MDTILFCLPDFFLGRWKPGFECGLQSEKQYELQYSIIWFILNYGGCRDLKGWISKNEKREPLRKIYSNIQEFTGKQKTDPAHLPNIPNKDAQNGSCLLFHYRFQRSEK